MIKRRLAIPLIIMMSSVMIFGCESKKGSKEETTTVAEATQAVTQSKETKEVETVFQGTSPMDLKLKNGVYTLKGKVSDHEDLINTKINMQCQKNKCTAIIQLKTDKYDKISIDKKIYKSLWEDGNASFEINVRKFDYDMEVELINSKDKNDERVPLTLSLDSSTIKLEKEFTERDVKKDK